MLKNSKKGWGGSAPKIKKSTIQNVYYFETMGVCTFKFTPNSNDQNMALILMIYSWYSLELLESPMSKVSYKSLVKRWVISFWDEELRVEAGALSSLTPITWVSQLATASGHEHSVVQASAEQKSCAVNGPHLTLALVKHLSAPPCKYLKTFCTYYFNLWEGKTPHLFLFLSSANEVSTGPTCQFGYVCPVFSYCLNDPANFAWFT